MRRRPVLLVSDIDAILQISPESAPPSPPERAPSFVPQSGVNLLTNLVLKKNIQALNEHLQRQPEEKGENTLTEQLNQLPKPLGVHCPLTSEPLYQEDAILYFTCVESSWFMRMCSAQAYNKSNVLMADGIKACPFSREEIKKVVSLQVLLDKAKAQLPLRCFKSIQALLNGFDCEPLKLSEHVDLSSLVEDLPTEVPLSVPALFLGSALFLLSRIENQALFSTLLKSNEILTQSITSDMLLAQISIHHAEHAGKSPFSLLMQTSQGQEILLCLMEKKNSVNFIAAIQEALTDQFASVEFQDFLSQIIVLKNTIEEVCELEEVLASSSGVVRRPSSASPDSSGLFRSPDKRRRCDPSTDSKDEKPGPSNS